MLLIVVVPYSYDDSSYSYEISFFSKLTIGLTGHLSRVGSLLLAESS
jgi:hypothetical protein